MPSRFHLPRVEQLPTYVFSLLLEMKDQALSRGEDIIDLGMGNPDIPTAAPIVSRLKEEAGKPANHRYAPGKGMPELRNAICQWYQRRFRVDLDPETEVISTLGAKPGLAHLLISVVSSGDRVALPNPHYPIHHYAVVIAGGQVVHYPVSPEGDFSERLFSILEKENLKVVILNFPHNPTTATVDLKFFERVVEIARRKNWIVIHDFAYGDLVFDGFRAPSILEVPGAKEVCVEFYSMSKGFSMPGWRVGFCLGNRELIAALERMKSYLDYGIFRPIQWAAVEAFTKSFQCVGQNVATYQKRRDTLLQALFENGWKVPKPKATMFVWAKMPEKFQTLGSFEFAKKLLTEIKVVVSPGICFGVEGEGHIRFSLVESEDRLQEAAKRIGKVL